MFVFQAVTGRAFRGIVLAAGIAVAATACDFSATESIQRTSEGVIAAQSGNNSAAVRSFELALGLDPANAKAHYFLGLIRLQQYQDPTSALPNLEQAVVLDPENAEARYQLGIARERVERFEDAAATFEEVLAFHPTHAGALYRLGLHAEASGEIRDAIDYYTRSIYADPYFSLGYNKLGNIYVRYERPQEAIQVFQNGIENAPEEDPDERVGNAMNRADLGMVYLSLNELDLAVSYLSQARSMHPSSSSIPFNLGVAYARRYDDGGGVSDRDAAIEALTQARAQCNPAEEQARCNSIAAALRDLRRDARGE